MRSNVQFILAALLSIAVIGCGREYEHRKIGSQDAEFQAIATLLQTLRTEGIDKALDRSAAAGLQPDQRQAVRAVLEELVEAKRVELLSVDQFGDHLYRAIVRIDNERSVPLLLVRSENEEFHWAGRN